MFAHEHCTAGSQTHRSLAPRSRLYSGLLRVVAEFSLIRSPVDCERIMCADPADLGANLRISIGVQSHYFHYYIWLPDSIIQELKRHCNRHVHDIHMICEKLQSCDRIFCAIRKNYPMCSILEFVNLNITLLLRILLFF